MRSCPRGFRRSVDRGAHRPAIEPRKIPILGADAVQMAEGKATSRTPSMYVDEKSDGRRNDRHGDGATVHSRGNRRGPHGARLRARRTGHACASVAFVRRRECVPNRCGSKPTLAIHSPRGRAYCRVVRLRAGPPRPLNRYSPGFLPATLT